MILGQKLKNAALQLGNKSIGALHTLGNKIILEFFLQYYVARNYGY